MQAETPRRYTEPEWRSIAANFETRMRARLDVVRRERRERGRDPVMDFLFEYYSFKPARLCRWSPGFGVVLEGGAEMMERRGFCEVEGGVALLAEKFPPRRHGALRWIHQLLSNVQARQPALGCFGMHEWAMVYRTDLVRHAQWPLRMTADEIAEFVESRPVRCSHYDAHRFFTEAAKPLNRLQPTYDEMLDFEQPGCLHTNMDLYRWAYKFYPWISSERVEEGLELAIEARTLDMRASPYDLKAMNLDPIPVETSEGRQRYQELQRELWEKGLPVRQRLIEAYRVIIDAVG